MVYSLDNLQNPVILTAPLTPIFLGNDENIHLA